jgi:hypothetical protein
MKIRAATVLAGLSGVQPMNNVGAKGMYIQSVGGRWWVKRKGAILANLPYTIENPHPGQIEVRVKFGAIASGTAGMPLSERLQIIAERMRGYRAPHRIDDPNQYPSRKRRSFHTVAELESLLRKKLAQRGEKIEDYMIAEAIRTFGF